MDKPSGMPTSYVKKDGTTFQYCGSGAPVVGLAAATTRTGGQLKRTKDNTPEAMMTTSSPDYKQMYSELRLRLNGQATEISRLRQYIEALRKDMAEDQQIVRAYNAGMTVRELKGWYSHNGHMDEDQIGYEYHLLCEVEAKRRLTAEENADGV
jgi:hypothetical protein